MYLEKSLIKLKVTVEKTLSADVLALLKRTIYGQKGKLQYRHKYPEHRIETLQNPAFVTLRKENKLLGVAGFMFRNTFVKGKEMTSWYIRYLSMNVSQASKNRKGEISESKKNYKRSRNSIKNKLKEVFSTISDDHIAPEVFYAVVEKENQLSQEFCASFGFEKVRNIEPVIFSRFFPKSHKNVSRIIPEEKDFVSERLQNYYSNHMLWFNSNIFLDDNYFVFKRNNEIVAGIKATPVIWEMLAIPGAMGFLIQKVLPHLPLFSKFLKSKNLEFLALESLWYKAGHEEDLITLMERVLAEFKIHLAMIWLDSESDILEALKNTGKLGLMGKLQKNVPADLLVKFSNIPKEDKRLFFDRPAYISGLDVT